MKNRANHEIGTYLNFAEPDTERVVYGKQYKKGQTIDTLTKGKVTLVGFRDNSAIVHLENGHKTVVSYREFKEKPSGRVTKDNFHFIDIVYLGNFIQEKGWTQAFAAKKIGRSDSFIGGLINKKKVRPRIIDELVDGLGLDREKLVASGEVVAFSPRVYFDRDKTIHEIKKVNSINNTANALNLSPSGFYRMLREGNMSRANWNNLIKYLDVDEKRLLEENK